MVKDMYVTTILKTISGCLLTRWERNNTSHLPKSTWRPKLLPGTAEREVIFSDGKCFTIEVTIKTTEFMQNIQQILMIRENSSLPKSHVPSWFWFQMLEVATLTIFWFRISRDEETLQRSAFHLPTKWTTISHLEKNSGFGANVNFKVLEWRD